MARAIFFMNLVIYATAQIMSQSVILKKKKAVAPFVIWRSKIFKFESLIQFAEIMKMNHRGIECLNCGEFVSGKLEMIVHVSVCVLGDSLVSSNQENSKEDESFSSKKLICYEDAEPKLGSNLMEEKVFKCRMCDKTFSRKLTLTRHMQTHSDEKPFPCHICGKRLSRKDVLMLHLKSHMPVQTMISKFV